MSDSTPTDEQMLAAIRAAKLEILTGGSASISGSGHSRTFLSLDELSKEEARLEARIAAKGGSGRARVELL